MARVNVLYLDKEGGFGGSSRSLYFLIKHMDRTRFLPLVVLRERGPALEWYRELGVRTFVCESFPVYKPSPRNNLWVLFLFLRRMGSFVASGRWVLRLIAENAIHLIHMNHDSFFVYGFFVRRSPATKVLIHMRTMLPRNRYAAMQARGIERVADQLIFISENEQALYRELLGRKSVKGEVIYNSFEAMEGAYAFGPSESRPFKVLYLGNLTYNKGADRLIDLALDLKARGGKDILFLVCGEDRGEGGGQSKGSVASKAGSSGVGSYFRFMGHQADPNRFLAECHALIRLSRWNDPWGRDIIEAMANGKPVLATGTYDGFVQQGVNGFLYPEFDSHRLGDDILRLAGDPGLCRRLGDANREKAKRLFDGPRNAARVAAVYEAVLSGSRE